MRNYKFLKEAVSLSLTYLKFKFEKVYQNTKLSASYLWNKVDYFGKKLLWLITILIIVISFINIAHDSSRQNIVIEKLNLPDEHMKTGYSSSNIIKSSISDILESTSPIQNSNKKINSFFNSPINNQTEECGSDRPRILTNTLSNIIDVNFHSDIDSLEIATPEKDLSLNIFLNYLKKITGKSNIIIYPSIINLGQKQGFLTKVSVKYPDNFYHSTELKSKSIDEAQLNLTMLILKYFNPFHYALKVFNSDSAEAEDSIIVAINHNPSFKNQSSPFTLLGYLFYERGGSDAFKSESYFDQAIKINKKDLLALWGKAMLNRALITEKRNKLPAKQLNLEDSKIADLLIESKEYAAQGYILKAFIYENENDIKNTIATYKKAMKRLPNNEEIFIEYAATLIFHKNFKKAETLINNKKKSEKFNVLSKNSNTILYQSLVLEYSKSIYILEELKPKVLQLNKCNLNRWINYIIKEYYKTNKFPTPSNLLAEHLDFLFIIGERKGLGDSFFYNSWGTFLHSEKLYHKAHTQYIKALEYPNKKLKTFSNIAYNFIELGDFKKAAEFFTKSLTNEGDSKIIYYYLMSVFHTKDYPKYINEFKKWGEELNRDELQFNYNILLINASLSYCKLQIKDKATSLYEKISDNEAKKEKSFMDLNKCLSDKKSELH